MFIISHFGHSDGALPRDGLKITLRLVACKWTVQTGEVRCWNRISWFAFCRVLTSSSALTDAKLPQLHVPGRGQWRGWACIAAYMFSINCSWPSGLEVVYHNKEYSHNLKKHLPVLHRVNFGKINGGARC